MRKREIKTALKILTITMGVGAIAMLALKGMLNKTTKAVNALGKMAWANNEDAEAEIYNEVSAMVMAKDNRAKVSV